MSGKLYALSTGPGAADLITVRAARILGQLDVLYAPAGRKGGDSLALSIVREYLGAHTEVRCCHFPMSADSAEKEAVWNDVTAALAQEVAAGRQVGFITLGDAMLFSTWVFLLQRIGCPDWLEIVPGVTSFAAIAARAKTPLAMEQQSLAVISCTAPEADIAAALRQHDSLVLMKVYGRFARIKALLAQAGLLDAALMMSEATLPGEQCWRRLREVSDDQPLPYFSTILVNKQWEEAFAMHIMEGFLPPMWALAWWLLFLPCLWYGLVRLRRIVQEESNQKVLLALCGAFIFVLSALKIPSVTGSCSHPTGVGLAVILFGPGVVAVLGAIVLLFQALLLAHGGLTTLGANGMSMAVIGPMVGYLVWKLACRAGIRRDVGVFLCAMLADLMTYFVTSVQLGVAFPDPATGAGGSIAKFMGIFCLTQIPIAIAEGLLTVMIYDQLTKRRLIAAEAH